MADIVKYSTGSTPNPVTDYLPNQEAGQFAGQSNVLVLNDSTSQNLSKWNAVRALVAAGIPIRYWKHVSGEIQEMTSGEKTSVDAAIATANAAAVRLGAKNIIVGFDHTPLLERAFADVIKDEINIIRQWTVSYKAEVAAATSLANLQTRVAALPTLNDRTLAQLKTAINNRIDSGDVDS